MLCCTLKVCLYGSLTISLINWNYKSFPLRTVGDKYDVNGGDLFDSLTELIEHYKVKTTIGVKNRI